MYIKYRRLQRDENAQYPFGHYSVTSCLLRRISPNFLRQVRRNNPSIKLSPINCIFCLNFVQLALRFNMNNIPVLVYFSALLWYGLGTPIFAVNTYFPGSASQCWADSGAGADPSHTRGGRTRLPSLHQSTEDLLHLRGSLTRLLLRP